MATTWEQVSDQVLTILKGSLPNATVKKIGSVADYLVENTGQAIFEAKDILVLLSPPDGVAEDIEPMLSRYKRKVFLIDITVVAKTDPLAKNRQSGKGPKKGIFEVRADIVEVLEHSNLGGLVDNKAGANFESGWTRVDSDGRSFTAYTTLYTVHKTEK